MRNRANRRVQRKRIEKVRFSRFHETAWMDEERNWQKLVLKKEMKEPPQGVYSKWTGHNCSVSNQVAKKQRNKRERQMRISERGFTLLELLIVVVILGLLIVVVGGILFVVL